MGELGDEEPRSVTYGGLWARPTERAGAGVEQGLDGSEVLVVGCCVRGAQQARQLDELRHLGAATQERPAGTGPEVGLLGAGLLALLAAAAAGAGTLAAAGADPDPDPRPRPRRPGRRRGRGPDPVRDQRRSTPGVPRRYRG